MKFGQKITGIILSYIVLAINLVVSVVFTPIVLQYLGEEEYGIYSLSQSFIGYLGVLLPAINSGYIISSIKARKEDEIETNYTFFCVYLLVDIIITIIGLLVFFCIPVFAGDNIPDNELVLLRCLFAVMLGNLLITVSSGLFSAYITKEEAFVFQKAIVLVGKIMYPLFSYILLIKGYKSLALAVVSCVIAFLQLLSRMFFCKRNLHLRIKRSRVSRDLLLWSLGFSVFVIIQSIAEQLYLQVDKIIIIQRFGSGMVAVYTLGCHFNDVFLTISKTITSIFMPRIHKLNREYNCVQINNLHLFLSRWQFYILSLVYIVFFVWGKEFFVLWVGTKYVDAYYVAIGTLFFRIWGQSQESIIEQHKDDYLFKCYIISYLMVGVVNVFISVWLCELIGMLGCVCGTIFSYLLQEVVCVNILYRGKGINSINKARVKLLPIIMLHIVCAFCLKRIIAGISWMELALAVIIFGIASCVIAYLLFCNDEDRNMIKNIIRGRKNE